jgi:hypothetical protein
LVAIDKKQGCTYGLLPVLGEKVAKPDVGGLNRSPLTLPSPRSTGARAAFIGR